MAQLIDELFLRAFDNEWLRAGQRPGARSPVARRAAWSWRPTATWCRRCSFPAATSAASRCTARSTTSRWRAPAALSCGRLHPRGRLSARRPEAHRRVDGGGVARRRRADRHRRHQGRRAGQGRRRVHHHHRRRASCPTGVDISRRPRAAGRRDAASAARIGDHGVAIMSQREKLDVRDRRSRPTRRRCTGWSRRWWPRCPASTCLRDPTRGGLATTLNEIASQSGVRHDDRRSARSR